MKKFVLQRKSCDMSRHQREAVRSWVLAAVDFPKILGTVPDISSGPDRHLFHQMRRISGPTSVGGRAGYDAVRVIPSLYRVEALLKSRGFALSDFVKDAASCPFELTATGGISKEHASAEVEYNQIAGLVRGDNVQEALSELRGSLDQLTETVSHMRDVAGSTRVNTSLATQAIRHAERVLRQSAGQIDACRRDLEQVIGLLEDTSVTAVNATTLVNRGKRGDEHQNEHSGG